MKCKICVGVGFHSLEVFFALGNSVVLGGRIAKEVVSRKLQRIRKTVSKLAEAGGKKKFFSVIIASPK